MRQTEIIMPELGYLMETFVCRRCKGEGYHHGFGEHGRDPDWCSCCHGPGVEWFDLLTPHET